jgi:hypothetical protein
MASKANPEKIHAKLAAILASLSDASERRSLFEALLAEANDGPRPLGTAGLAGIDGKMEQVSRYLSRIAQAENAVRGGAGSTRYTVLANLAALVKGTFRDAAGNAVEAMDPAVALDYTKRAARMGVSTASGASAARPDYATLFSS